MINQIFHKSTYWLAGLAIIFIVSFAFAQKGPTVNDSSENQATYLAKIDSLENFNQPAVYNQSGKSHKRLIAELNQRIRVYPKDYEASLLKVFAYIDSAEYAKAESLLDKLIEETPEFSLAHLIKGDLLAMQVRPLLGIGKNEILEKVARSKYQQELGNLRDEMDIRLKNYHNQFVSTKIPQALLLMSQSVDTAILIDKSKNRLYLFKRQNDLLPPKLIQDFYVSTGKLRGNKTVRGDLKTPEGVYFITRFIPDSNLPDKYGIGAFPVNYPNELDNKLGKTGYGIWLHGTTSDSYSRPPLDSEGCVVLPNIDLASIKHLITPGKTPIIIAESLQWIEFDEWSRTRKDVLASIESWRNDWQSLDVDKYLQHYDENFWSGSHNLSSWRARKKSLARSKKYQKIKFDDISLFAYPGEAAEEAIVVARFRQSYQSNNYNSEMHKRVYLAKNDNNWKILFEGK